MTFKEYIIEHIDDIYEDYLNEMEIVMGRGKDGKYKTKNVVSHSPTSYKKNKKSERMHMSPEERERRDFHGKVRNEVLVKPYLRAMGISAGVITGAHGAHAYAHRKLIKSIFKAKKSGDYETYYKGKTKYIRSLKRYGLVNKMIGDSRIRKYDKLLRLSKKNRKFITKLK